MWDFVSGVWNAVVAAFPVVFHAACQIADSAAKSITLP